MDMGFAVVYNVSHAMFPDGFGVEGTTRLGKTIRSTSKAQAAKHIQLGAEFYGRNGDKSGWDHDGGYALKQSWL